MITSWPTQCQDGAGGTTAKSPLRTRLLEMSHPIELFAYWTAQFEVTLVPPDLERGRPWLLRFRRKRGQRSKSTRDLFQTWFAKTTETRKTKVARQPIHLNAILSLSRWGPRTHLPSSSQAELLAVAEQLGPIFTALPAHGPEVVEEPAEHWFEAAAKFSQLIFSIKHQELASKDGSKTARRRMGFKRAREAIAGFHALPLDNQRWMAARYRPSPRLSARAEWAHEVAQQIDALWFLPIALRGENELTLRGIEHLRFPRLRLSSEGRSMQINVPFGIQALLIMLVYDQTIGTTLFPRACARAECGKIVLMGPRRQYCSDQCQRVVGAKRHREAERRKNVQAEARRTRRRKAINATQSRSEEG